MHVSQDVSLLKASGIIPDACVWISSMLNMFVPISETDEIN